MVKKEINKKQLSVSKPHFGVALEDIDSKLDLVVEGQQGLGAKIQGLDKKIDKNHVEFQEFREEVNYKFEVVFEKFDEVDTHFNNVKDELHIIRNELKEKVGRDEFILLEKRVIALEKSRK